MQDRMNILFCSMLGQVVDVTVKEGTVFRGILSSVKADDPMGVGVMLKMARKCEPGVDLDKVRPKETLVVLPRDFVQLVAPNTYLGGERGATSTNTFKTDSDISGRALQERELVMWDGGHELEMNTDWREKAETAGVDDAGNWDQFAANSELFGVECSFDEELYTTKLDLKGVSAEQMAAAARVAAEIEGTVDTSNLHRMMERAGDTMDMTNFDEEELYGAVMGTGRTQLRGRNVDAAGSSSLLSSMFQGAVADSAALPSMPKDAMHHDAISHRPPGPAQHDLVEKTSQERLKIKKILQNNLVNPPDRASKPDARQGPSSVQDQLNLDQTQAILSPEAQAEFKAFKLKEMREHAEKEKMQRQQTTDNLRAFSASFGKKPEEGPPKKSTLNPFAKAFKLNSNAQEFVPSWKSKTPAAPAAPAAPPAAAPASQNFPGPGSHPPLGQMPANFSGPGHPGPSFGPGGFQPQGAFPQQMPPQPVQMNLTEPEGEFDREVRVFELYAAGMNKVLSSTPYDPEEKSNLPGWPFGTAPFRSPDEHQQRGPGQMAGAAGQQVYMQGQQFPGGSGQMPQPMMVYQQQQPMQGGMQGGMQGYGGQQYAMIVSHHQGQPQFMQPQVQQQGGGPNRAMMGPGQMAPNAQGGQYAAHPAHGQAQYVVQQPMMQPQSQHMQNPTS